jgi:integrase
MSRRIVPIHKRLIDLGFVDYAKAQTEWLFPDLPHDGTEPGDTTALFSKWFGRWRRANGLYDPKRKVDFHSFRHAFKDACRLAHISEDMHDLLTGHAGNDNQRTSRGYKGADNPVFLSQIVNKVRFSTFPLRGRSA